MAELLFGIRLLPSGKRKDILVQALDRLMALFRNRVLPFDTDAAKFYAELAVAARGAGRAFPTADGYIAPIAASRRSMVASRDVAPYEAAKIVVIHPWE